MKEINLRRAFYLRLALAIVNFVPMMIVILTTKGSVPVHIAYDMRCDRVGSAWFLLIPALLPLVLAFGDRFPGQKRNAPVLTIMLLTLEALFVALGWIMVAMVRSGIGLGETLNLPLPGLLLLPIGLAFMIVANYTPRLYPNRMIGMRTRKTLRSDECWARAQRIGGRFGVLGGLALAVGGAVTLLTGSELIAVIALIAGVLLAAVGPALIALTMKS